MPVLNVQKLFQKFFWGVNWKSWNRLFSDILILSNKVINFVTYRSIVL